MERTLYQKVHLDRLDREIPGFTQRIWEQQGGGYTVAHDAACAKAIMEFHLVCYGEEICITPDGWKHHRHGLGLVAFKHHKKILLTMPEPAPQPVTPIGPMNGREAHITTSAQAIAALEQVISFLKRFGGFGIQEPDRDVGNAIDVIFGHNGLFGVEEHADHALPSD